MEDSLEKLMYPIGRFVPEPSYDQKMLNAWTDGIRTAPLLFRNCIKDLSELQLDTSRASCRG